jgi:hypothetical protein
MPKQITSPICLTKAAQEPSVATALLSEKAVHQQMASCQSSIPGSKEMPMLDDPKESHKSTYM